MKRTGFNDDDGNFGEVGGAHLGFACLLLGAPNAVCNETWKGI
jgi:hypothetical protein